MGKAGGWMNVWWSGCQVDKKMNGCVSDLCGQVDRRMDKQTV